MPKKYLIIINKIPYLFSMISQRRVAFLPFAHVSLKSLIPNAYDFEPETLGEHIKKKRLMKGMLQKELAAISRCFH